MFRDGALVGAVRQARDGSRYLKTEIDDCEDGRSWRHPEPKVEQPA